MKLKLTTGKVFETLEGENLLDTLKRNEIFLISSCEGKGTCGKCKVRLLEGKSDKRWYH